MLLITDPLIILVLNVFFEILIIIYAFLLIIGFFTRKKEILNESMNWKETFLPYFVMVIPFFFIIFPKPYYLTITAGFKFYGFLWIIFSLMYLRRYFSIEVEIRGHQTRGPYRLMRHPLYYGELILILSEILNTMNIYAFFLFLGLVIVICYRVYLEEQKFISFVPEYSEYSKKTPPFSLIWFCVKRICK